MITHDGFWKKQCFIERDNVVINGETYPIASISETENYKSKWTVVFVITLLMTAFIVYGGYRGIQDDIINNNNYTDRMVKAAFWLFIFGLFASLWWAVVKYGYKDCSNCRSFWIINGKGVYIEQNDDIGIEQRLREIGLKLRNYGGEDTKTCSSVKPNKRIKGWFVLIVSGFFFGIFALGMGNYIKENIFIPLLLIAVAVVIILRVYALKKDYDNMRWKK